MGFSLQEIAEKIKSCTFCPLSKNRTNAVPGDGPSKADIMIIGEGPGEDEDEQGRPFFGRAGKLLTQALESAGLKREEVFITNVVKCRPPENREPTIVERDTCMNNYLYKQIELVNPKVICLLGSVAVQALLGKRSVTAVRGKVFEKMVRVFFSTIHPAADYITHQ